MKRRVKAIGLGIVGSLFSMMVATPVGAAMSEAEQIAAWRWQLGRAYCAANWTEALSLAGALMGSDISPHERVWLFVLRQDMFNFQSDVAEFEGCDGGQITAGVTAQEALAASEPSSLNWRRERTVTSRRSSPTASALLRADRPQTSNATFSSTTTSEPNNQADTACPPVYARDRRVANGTVSNRWAYEIWQDNSGFRARYWQQSQTCNEARTTLHYSTQNAAYQAFRDAATYNESRGVLSGNNN
jgi:hypothetical protein